MNHGGSTELDEGEMLDDEAEQNSWNIAAHGLGKRPRGKDALRQGTSAPRTRAQQAGPIKPGTSRTRSSSRDAGALQPWRHKYSATLKP